MGVLGLWQLLGPVGQPVTLESLENKILAVDVSIWLNQAIKGYRDAKGGSVANAHLLSLFSRLCKLLYYKIRPIIVFDGGVPELKRQTVVNRRKTRAAMKSISRETALKMMASYLASKQVNKNAKSPIKKTVLSKIAAKDDLFVLPPLEKTIKSEDEDQGIGRFEIRYDHLTPADIKYLDGIDIESKEFKELPSHVKQEILTTLQEIRKHRNWDYYEQLPKESDEFSSYQMQNLLKRKQVRKKLEEVNNDTNKSFCTDIISLYSENFIGDPSQIMSDETSHYVYLKKQSEQVSTNAKKDDSNQSTASTSSYQKSSPSESKPSNCDSSLPLSQKLEKFVASNDSEKHSKGKSVPMRTRKRRQSGVKDVNVDQSMLSDDNDDYVQHKDSHSGETETSKAVPEVKNHQSFETESSCDSPEALNDSEIHEPLNSKQLEPSPKRLKLEEEVSSPDEIQIQKESISIKTEIMENEDDGHTESKNVEEKVVPKDKVIEVNHSDRTISQEMVISGACTSKDSSSENEPKISVTSDSTADGSGNFIEVPDDGSSDDENLDSIPDQSAEHKFIDQMLENSSNKQKDSDGNNDLNSSYALKGFKSLASTSRDRRVNESESVTLQDEISAVGAAVLKEMEAESFVLQTEQAKKERQAATVQEHMYEECQELLRYFGVPYVVSAMEAEAQCAFFDVEGVTDGTITDDSDVWLFGGTRVYKNFFNHDKFVEFFKDKEVQSHFGLNRKKLIAFAMLTGSDYTEGIEGVGPVTATEIISEFRGEGFDILEKFKAWWTLVNKQASPPKNKVRSKLQKLPVPQGFPNKLVFDAYLNPVVDNSLESFSWGLPDLDSLRDYTREKFGWNKTKLDAVLLPVIKKLNEKTHQMHLDSYFSVSLKKEQNLFPSKRIMSALEKISGIRQSNNEEECDDPQQEKKGKQTTKSAGKKPTKHQKRKQAPRASKKADVKKVLQLSEESSDES